MPAPVRILISHAREDRDAAREFCEALEQSGLPCWLASRDIAPGASRSRAFTAALAAGGAMLVLVSSNTARTKKVLQEIERAAKRGLTLVPVRIEQVTPPADLERLLGAAPLIDAPIGPGAAVVAAIAAAASSSVAVEPVATPEPAMEAQPAPASEPELEPEPAPEPEPQPVQVVERQAPRARVRPRVSAPPVPQQIPKNPASAGSKAAGIVVAIALVVLTYSFYAGRDNSAATATVALPRIDTSASQADADIVAKAIPALEAQAVAGAPTRAVRGALAEYRPDRPIDSVRSVGFSGEGVELTAHFVPEERLVIFTAVSSTTVAFVVEINPAGQFDLRAALAGSPPASPMRPLEDAWAATLYGHTMAQWAAYVRAR